MITKSLSGSLLSARRYKLCPIMMRRYRRRVKCLRSKLIEEQSARMEAELKLEDALRNKGTFKEDCACILLLCGIITCGAVAIKYLPKDRTTKPASPSVCVQKGLLTPDVLTAEQLQDFIIQLHALQQRLKEMECAENPEACARDPNYQHPKICFSKGKLEPKLDQDWSRC